ncbi:MAG: hypothetical protein FWE90_03045 [Defluviitaleaceae bacterium]|nr:hypothetical protein [Defluviitaleaceae bacterium]
MSNSAMTSSYADDFISLLDERDISQQIEINQLSMQLRNAYYSSASNEKMAYSTPYGGRMTESIGAWPEFILKGTFCKRSIKGFCSPCFYSRFPLSKSNRNEYINMIKNQLDYVTSKFDELIIKNQYGQALNEQPSANVDDVFFVLTPTGSFFDNFEFPINIRLEMEKTLLAISEEKGITIHLHIEAHCEDILNYDISNCENQTELDMLEKLNAMVILGFESSNEYSRNIVYNKNLSISNFESAVEKVKKANLTPGAFVFAGLFSYNDAQTHNDVISTVQYLISNDIFPVIMFQNVQPYTITDVLLKNKAISMIEPLTVAWIVNGINKLTEDKDSYWLIADPKGGPPDPDYHIFKNPTITCQKCTNAIYEELVALRKTRDTMAFNMFYENLKLCKCYERFRNYVDSIDSSYLSVRNETATLIQKCKQSVNLYMQTGGTK